MINKSIIIIIICFNAATFAQIQNLQFDHFKVENGISQSTVQAIMQDNHGFLWIGTKDGLNRFDGYKFYVYNFSKSDSNSISDGFIRSIIQDSFGNIWIGTNNGLNKYSVEQMPDNTFKTKFIHYLHNQENKNSISDNEIRAVCQTKNGDLWIGTSNGLNKVNAWQINGKNKNQVKLKFVSYKNEPGNKNSISKNIISSLAEDSFGNLWIGTFGGGLNKLNIKSNNFRHYLPEEKNANSLTSTYVMSLYCDNYNNLWIGTYNGGLVKLEITKEKFIAYQNSQNKNSISDDRIFSIQQDKDGNLWLATFGGGINKFDIEKNSFKNFEYNSHDEKSIRNDFVRCILIDYSNNLWAGTNESLEKTNLNPPKFFHYKNDPWDKNSLQDNHVFSILESSEGVVWIGMNKGLDRYSFETNSFEHYTINHNNPKSTGGFVLSIFEDSNKDIWLGTFGGGIYKYDKSRNDFIQYQYNSKSKNTIFDNRVISLNEDNNGNILIGTNIGICKLNKSAGQFSKFIYSSKDSVMLAGRRINAIYKDSKHRIWIGLVDGVVRVNKDSSCSEYVYDEADSTSLTKGNVNSFCEDSEGNIWIATDNGLNLYVRAKNNFKIYTKKDGLISNGIESILEADDGTIWISTDKGLSKFYYKPDSETIFKNYEVNDGLQGYDFNDNAGFKSEKGRLYFGGLNGFNVFNPIDIKENSALPKVVLTSFKKFDKEVLSIDALLRLKSLELSYTDRFFSFEFAALEFTNPARNRYAYMMEGFDKDWNYIGNRQYASYTNLDPGKYVFKVKASNNDGIWNEDAASLTLIITPPYYQTWWAYSFYGIVLILSFYSVRKYELNKRIKIEEENLRKEREQARLNEIQLRAEAAEYKAKMIETEKEAEKQQIRNGIATDLHDEIGSNLSSIMLLTSLMDNNLRENKNAGQYIGNIYNAAKVSAEAIRDIVWFINPSSDNVGRLLSRMNETANTMLKGLTYTINSSKIGKIDKLTPEIKRNLYLSFKEILNNIIKHSQAKNVQINIWEEKNIFNLSVKDDGIGFDENEVVLGNGLKNIKFRMKKISGDIEIKSQKNDGSLILIKIEMA